jgi:maltooligosyltrehalose trehalohydrolase
MEITTGPTPVDERAESRPRIPGFPGQDSSTRRRRIGAEVMVGGGVSFRVWSPGKCRVDVILEGGPGAESNDGASAIALEMEGDGYFAGTVSRAAAGTLYRYRLDNGEAFPDPASRYQPQGPHGPSEVIDPTGFPWTDLGWSGLTMKGQVLYELHVGTFTMEGTWKAAISELPALKELGITCLELMPVAEFPGRFGWGYDGVDLFAPYHVYGSTDDFRRFVDTAHGLGLGVILDVVYNHLGPDGAYHKNFSGDYYNPERAKSDWGEALNFDGPDCGPVRDFFIANAGSWIGEFHLDGLRLDATQAILDDSDDHIVAAIARHARAVATEQGRAIILIAEDDSQNTVRVRPTKDGGWGLDAQWNDDFHHAAVVALTGRSEAYYSDFLGTPQELISAIRWGFLFQGQYSSFQDKSRGTPTFGLPASAFVTYLENHDQVSNSARGDRLHRLTSPGRFKAMTAAWLLAPGTPMFFQGQEYGDAALYPYFADHVEDLARLVQKGRYESLGLFRSIGGDREVLENLPIPDAPETFMSAKLKRGEGAEVLALHRDLLALRRQDPIFRAQDGGQICGAVIGPEAFILRYFGEGQDTRLVIVNLGRDLMPNPLSEPLYAPPPGKRWAILWYSEHPRYGGGGAPPLETISQWRSPGHAAIVLQPADSSVANETTLATGSGPSHAG